MGTDADLGLPAGTTPGCAIRVPVEEQPLPPEEAPGTPDDGEAPVYDPKGPNPTRDLGQCSRIASGHQDLRASWKTGYHEIGYPVDPTVELRDDSTNPARTIGSYELDVTFHVKAKRTTTTSEVSQNYASFTLYVAVGDAAIADVGCTDPSAPTTSDAPSAGVPVTSPQRPSNGLPATGE